LSNAQIKAVLSDGKTLQIQSFLSLNPETGTSGLASFERGGGNVRGDEKYINYGCYCTPSEG